jgi:NhaP-type Na+/H+ or K+/H+ antiporter
MYTLRINVYINLYSLLLGTSWAYLLLLYVFVQLSRTVVVSVLYPLLSQFGYGLDLKESGILIWSGLRGAVALSLSMSVKVRTNYLIGLSRYL